MTASPPPSPDTVRLSAFDIGCVVVGGILGVGIFFTPGTVASRVDSAGEVMLAWGLGGLLAALGALVFAELGARVPGHGGIFRYLHAAFGRWPAFLYGWANWLVIQAGALSVVALLCIEHVERAVFGHGVCSPGLRVLLAAALILVLMATNLCGLRVGKRVQNTLVVAKVAALCLLVAAALVAVVPDADRAAAVVPGGAAVTTAASLAGRLGAAILPVLFAIGGWQQGSFLAGAARTPRRDVPLGILGGVAVVLVVYLAINVAYIDLLGFAGAQQSRQIGADAAQRALGLYGERVFAAMVAVSAMGIMNTICMAPPYVLLTMAEAGLFPRAFARRHPVHGTPWVGVLGQGLWATLLLLLAHGLAMARHEDAGATLSFVCDSVVFVDWLFFGLCGIALLRLRRGGAATPFFVLGGGLAALLFAGGSLAVTVGAVATTWEPSLVGAGLVLLGIPVAWWLWPGTRR